MASQPPLLLVENMLDVVQQYPTASIVSSGEAVGREARRVSDYRRERTYWMPTAAGERPHLDFSANTAGASDQRRLRGAANLLSTAGTSHSWCFLFRSAGALTGSQVLLHINGATNLSLWRYGAGGSGIGFNDGAQKNFGSAAAPTDDAWHTLIFVFDGAAGVANFYLDGVQAGTANVAYTPVVLDSANGVTIMCANTGGSAVPGRLGRFGYYGRAITPTDCANVHAVLMAEDRVQNTFNAGADWLWDPFVGQGTQQLTDLKQGKVFTLGDTTAVESNAGTNDANDPFWDGGHFVGSFSGNLSTNWSFVPDACWIDRGHNLWGCAVGVEGTRSNTATTHADHTDRSFPALLVPALDASGNYVPGGDPTTGWCVTEEGALYTLLANASSKIANPVWRVRVIAPSASFIPIIPGIILGRRTQLPYYSATYDEDQGERVQRTEQSDAGYLATGRTYSWRTLELDLQVIGDTTYDSQIRTLRKQLFEAGQPFVAVLNYGTNPERAWLFQQADTRWGFPKKGAYRAGKLTAREVGAKVR